MKIRRGVSAIIFVRDKCCKRKYLLLKRKMYWTGWEWLKGGCKKRENELACLEREIKEETGKKVEEYIVTKTNIIFSFKYERPFVHDGELWSGAKNRVYLIELNNKRVKIDNDEHSGYKWVSKADALKLITYKDQKRIFKKLVK